MLDSREETVLIDLAAPPTMVVFDEGNSILKTLAFDQPTTWLATQLKRDPDLWNRAWVIQQLVRRSNDSVAARAIADAVTGADYPATRAHAAEALPAFAPAVAMPALETALRDTAATVRQAALEALGEFGGPRVADLARNALQTDTSYEVRAAAVATLVAADTGARRTVIPDALATPSYQDVVRTAALRAIAQSGDTSFIPQVEGLLGVYRVPTQVLAALGNRGSTRALDVLTAHLDDARPQVRRWVLQAFQNGVQRDLAIARLRAVEGKLKYPDTRKNAAALRQRLEERKPGA
jgi:HEAT repeat protein